MKHEHYEGLHEGEHIDHGDTVTLFVASICIGLIMVAVYNPKMVLSWLI